MVSPEPSANGKIGATVSRCMPMVLLPAPIASWLPMDRTVGGAKQKKDPVRSGVPSPAVCRLHSAGAY